MSKPIRCNLWVSTKYKMINFGEFDSIAAAKQYVRECITSRYQIIPIK